VALSERPWTAFAAAFIAVGWCACKKPAEPPLDVQESVDASSAVRSIQAEQKQERRRMKAVARSQEASEREGAASLAGVRAGQSGIEGRDGGEAPGVATEGEHAIEGKLEQAADSRVIIRDGSGFEYWLGTGDTTRVSQNGEPARLSDFPKGAAVRVSYVWRGNERVATGIQVLDGGR
jgi:hypothetical protein